MHRFKKYRPSPAMVVALAAVIVACAGTATAASLITSKQIKNGTIKRVDLSKGLRGQIDDTVFAKVENDGTLLRGRRVSSVSRTSAGDYQVVFSRNLSRCSPVASVRSVVPTEFYGFITTYTPASDTVRVVTRNRVGSKTDSGFNLVVVC